MDWLSQRIGYGRWSLRANEDFSLERAKGIETLFHNFRNATIIEST